jgi:5-(carboxyamino)imidazole ribonucleotide synthase
MAMVAQARGWKVAVLDPEPDAPAHQVAHHCVVAAYDDPEGLRQLAELCDVVTFEFENVPASSLEPFAARGIPMRPGALALATSQDRITEKTAVRKAGIATASWRAILAVEDLETALAELGGDAILKTSRSGYDGKGQARVRDLAQAQEAFVRFGSVPCVLEGVVPFLLECSVLAARDVSGACETFAVCENMHANHILDVTVVPARVSESASRAMRSAAMRLAEELEYVGHLAVEFFVLPDQSVLVNEMAPRPHNSGHLTIDAALHGQFEQHVRAVAGLPVLPYELLFPASAMANLLGDVWEKGEPRWETLAEFPQVRLHLYGKASPRPGRKMGHLTAWADTPEEAEVMVRAARAALQG